MAVASPAGAAAADRHFVTGRPIGPPFPAGLATAVFALGCFWGAERVFWQLPGVFTTAVGYAGGDAPAPTYAQVCGGTTGHAEAVLVVYDPAAITYRDLLRAFWQAHDPTQGMRQGNDIGSQYRSAIFPADAAQLAAAEQSRDAYQARLTAAGRANITTEITAEFPAPPFHHAEAEHQQYLAKNPSGYCGLGGTGVAFA